MSSAPKKVAVLLGGWSAEREVSLVSGAAICKALGVAEAVAYLEALGRWIDERRRELDTLDEAILASPQSQSLTKDMVLSLSLWQAVKARHDVLLVTWDSGRVGARELERLAALIWGRLDDTVPGPDATAPGGGALGGLAVSLPEACRLSDALAGQLRSRLALDPAADQAAGRLRQLRAQLERLRDQVALEPSTRQPELRAAVDDLAARTSALVEKVERGGDVGGLLGPLEVTAATMERDLIVENTRRRQNRDKLERARDLLEALRQRQQALSELVATTVRTVTPAPKYAVPNLDALGPLPNRASELDAYLAKLTQVSTAMQVVQTSYGRALDAHTAMRAELESLRARAAATAAREDAGLRSLADVAQAFLDRSPAPVAVVRHLLDAYGPACRTRRSSRRRWSRDTRAACTSSGTLLERQSVQRRPSCAPRGRADRPRAAAASRWPAAGG